MFVGAVPREVAEQFIRCVPVDKWKELYICCSGSLRMEQAFGQAFPGVPIHSNDVSLFTCALGKLAVGEQVDFTFRERLAFVEELLDGASYTSRVAALMVAHDMSRFAGKSLHNRKHFDFYASEFAGLMVKCEEKLLRNVAAIKIASFNPCDWRTHAEEGIARGAGLAAFPPFWMGGYEKLYKFLGENIDWQSPEYDVYDPKMLDGILLSWEERGVPYCVISDQVWEHRKPSMEYIANRRKPHYGYWSEGGTSVRHFYNKGTPFKYTPVDPDALTEETTVDVIVAEAKHLNFLRDVYLSKGIVHSTGLVHLLVYLGGKLAGGIIYSLARFGSRSTIYMLSDFAIVEKSGLAKLVASICRSRQLVKLVEKRTFERIDLIVTTAFSNHPESMKYRGVFELQSRKKGPEPYAFQLQYHAAVREETPKELYLEWLRKKNNAGKQQTRRRRRS